MIHLPKKCLRGRCDCQPLSQIESDDGESFICCGHNDGTSRTHPTDNFRLCWKNAETDSMHDYDQRDLIDTASVINQALSADANMKTSAPSSLDPILNQLIEQARERKKRVRQRLRDLYGDNIRFPSRGPVNRKGRLCHRWIFYKRAVENHRRATERVTNLASFMQQAREWYETRSTENHKNK